MHWPPGEQPRACPACSDTMHVFEKGKFGPFLSCDSFPRCKGSLKLFKRWPETRTRDYYARRGNHEDTDDIDWLDEYTDPYDPDLFADEHFS